MGVRNELGYITGQGQGPSEGQGQERENFPFTLEDTARFMASFG